MIEYIKDDNLVNEYAFVQAPTKEEIEELKSKGFTYFTNMLNPETDEWSEMWIK